MSDVYSDDGSDCATVEGGGAATSDLANGQPKAQQRQRITSPSEKHQTTGSINSGE